MGKLTKILKSAAHEVLKNKETKQNKVFNNTG
jgi:hypothetical protein